jgi:glutamate formiminotransferase/formiminotetrahydrofolate cyclodeaminase
MQLMECIPNFSEGRDKKVIDAIVGAISEIAGIRILDIDIGSTVNRSVITFVGPPETVSDAAYAAIKCAAQKIDMRRHNGLHPRLGSTDVCPFVPVKGITEESALLLVDTLAQRIGKELGIPVYLYEKSAKYPHRKDITPIRRGQYEKMAEKMRLPGWQPDHGPCEFNEHAGVTVMGVRDFLVAFNINIKGNVLEEAKQIARYLREQRTSGRLKFLKAMAWYLPEIDRTQVTTNLTNYKVTAIHTVFEEVKQMAVEKGFVVTGSEVVGMVPFDALIKTGQFYAGERNISQEDLTNLAVKCLNLNDLYPFNLTKKILGPF